MTALGWIVLVAICVGLAAALAARLVRGLRPSLPPARQHQLLSVLLIFAIGAPVVLPFIDLPSLTRTLPAALRSSINAPAALGAATTDVSVTIVKSATTPEPGVAERLSPVMRGLAALWAIVAIAMTVRLAGGLWYTARLRSDARPADEDLASRVERLATRAVTKVPVVLLSDNLDVPVTMGWWRPAIVVPERLRRDLSSRELDLVLSHELAHVRRSDYASGVLHAFIAAVAAVSPGHWQLVRLARRVREEACDDLAIGIAGDAAEFGSMLGRLAGLANGQRTALACSAVWNVADRIKRLSPSFVPSRIGAAHTALAATLFVASMVLTSESVVLAKQAAAVQPGASAVQANPDPEAQHFLASSGIVSGYLFHQPNSPVRLDSVLPSRSYVFDTVVLRNVFAKKITAVMFNAIVERQTTPIVIVSSPSIGLSLEPGHSVEVPAHFMTLDEASKLKVDKKVQSMLAVARVEFEDGTQWGAPIDISAHSASDAIGIHSVTLPREFLSAALPPKPSDPTSCYGGYSEDEQFTQGAIVAIQGETGRFARCIEGRWVEVDLQAMKPEHAAGDMRQNGVIAPIDRRITVFMTGASLVDIVAFLSHATGVTIAIHPDVPPLTGLSLDVKNVQLLAALQTLLQGHQLTSRVIDSHAIVVEPSKPADR